VGPDIEVPAELKFESFPGLQVAFALKGTAAAAPLKTAEETGLQAPEEM